MLNHIQAEMRQSEYADRPHLVITVDGEPLDVIIFRRTENRAYLGLVPTLLDWLRDPAEHDVVWQRVVPATGCRHNAPILMCPDDADLWCTVIITDIETKADTVQWHRLGLEVGKGDAVPQSIGADVEWFTEIKPFSFARDAYHACIEAFRDTPTCPRSVS
jgi:hypothetical protein